MYKVGLFQKVDSNDKEGLFGKGYEAAKWLRILAIVGIVIILLTLLPMVFGVGMLGAALGVAGGAAVGAYTGVVLVIYVLLYLIVGGGFTILAYIYSNSLMKFFERGVAPKLTLAYVFIVFQILVVIRTFFSEGSGILQIIYSVFVAYLWYVVIDCTKKAEQL